MPVVAAMASGGLLTPFLCLFCWGKHDKRKTRDALKQQCGVVIKGKKQSWKGPRLPSSSSCCWIKWVILLLEKISSNDFFCKPQTAGNSGQEFSRLKLENVLLVWLDFHFVSHGCVSVRSLHALHCWLKSTPSLLALTWSPERTSTASPPNPSEIPERLVCFLAATLPFSWQHRVTACHPRSSYSLVLVTFQIGVPTWAGLGWWRC